MKLKEALILMLWGGAGFIGMVEELWIWRYCVNCYCCYFVMLDITADLSIHTTTYNNQHTNM